jgi:hypothetical protein
MASRRVWTVTAAVIVIGIYVAWWYVTRPKEPFDIELNKSPLGGKGVFATRDFRKGEVVEEAPIMTAPSGRWGTALKDYLFTDTDATKNVLVLGYGAMYNHADKPNLEYEMGDGDDTFRYVATRAIKAGEELLISYGSEWWQSRTKIKRELTRREQLKSSILRST